jgi:hypothetical protein
MSLDELRFTPELLAKPPRTWLTAETTLKHFVTVTYAVDPAVLRRHLHPRFEPDCIAMGGGAIRALISVVTFVDRDFRFSKVPWLKNHFGQTNYRSYVLDTETGEHAACSSAPVSIRSPSWCPGTRGNFHGTAVERASITSTTPRRGGTRGCSSGRARTGHRRCSASRIQESRPASCRDSRDSRRDWYCSPNRPAAFTFAATARWEATRFGTTACVRRPGR